MRFLQLAAVESGQILNYANISQESGISQPTVKAYYQLLEDMFVGIRVPAYSKSPRQNLLSTPKFLFFDLGVRHAAAGLVPSVEVVRANPGPVFVHEKSREAKHGYVVCRCPRPLQLHDKVTALPWFCL